MFLLFLSYWQPTSCYSRRSSPIATWLKQWNKGTYRSVRWRNVSPCLRTTSGTCAETRIYKDKTRLSIQECTLPKKDNQNTSLYFKLKPIRSTVLPAKPFDSVNFICYILHLVIYSSWQRAICFHPWAASALSHISLCLLLFLPHWVHSAWVCFVLHQHINSSLALN